LNCKKAVDEKLAKVLPDCKGVCFTADYWTSRSADPYLGMTLHYVDKEFEMNKLLVACRHAEGRHTAVNIGGHIDKVVGAVSGLKGSTIRVCVTDNAANMLAAVPKHTKKIDVGLGCFDHLLNLVMKASNKEKADDQILKAIKVISVKLCFCLRYFS
jgi:hypothetical protein